MAQRYRRTGWRRSTTNVPHAGSMGIHRLVATIAATHVVIGGLLPPRDRVDAGILEHGLLVPVERHANHRLTDVARGRDVGGIARQALTEDALSDHARRGTGMDLRPMRIELARRATRDEPLGATAVSAKSGRPSKSVERGTSAHLASSPARRAPAS